MNRVDAVIHFLQEHVQYPLSIDDIARFACLSPVQLYRVFKKATGLTPIQYHEQLRINKSLQLLVESERVCDVAYDLGYENYETFSRAFKKLYSISPSDLLWGCSFIENQVRDENFALVKEEATLYQIKQLILSSEELSNYNSSTKIYRIYPKIKGRPEFKRCTRSEELIKLELA